MRIESCNSNLFHLLILEGKTLLLENLFYNIKLCNNEDCDENLGLIVLVHRVSG